ncbi:hypothetical protein ACH5RR_020935, partial [Cinchona calisaya]
MADHDRRRKGLKKKLRFRGFHAAVADQKITSKEKEEEIVASISLSSCTAKAA